MHTPAHLESHICMWGGAEDSGGRGLIFKKSIFGENIENSQSLRSQRFAARLCLVRDIQYYTELSTIKPILEGGNTLLHSSSGKFGEGNSP